MNKKITKKTPETDKRDPTKGPFKGPFVVKKGSNVVPKAFLSGPPSRSTPSPAANALENSQKCRTTQNNIKTNRIKPSTNLQETFNNS